MVRRVGYALVFGVLLFPLLVTSAFAASSTYSYTFEPHSRFFSAETKQTTVVDPQVLVADPSAAAAVGPQNIPHVAGYRPAHPGTDPATAQIFTAQGHALGITLGAWLGARGSGTITCHGDTATATNHFTGLIPGALYQLNRLQFTAQGPTRSPMGKPDGSDSVFTAGKDGTATITSSLPYCPGPTEGVVLAYHSDGQNHGAALGTLGVNLHNQLATRISQPTVLPKTGGFPVRTFGTLAIVLGLLLASLGIVVRRTVVQDAGNPRVR